MERLQVEGAGAQRVQSSEARAACGQEGSRRGCGLMGQPPTQGLPSPLEPHPWQGPASQSPPSWGSWPWAVTPPVAAGAGMSKPSRSRRWGNEGTTFRGELTLPGEVSGRPPPSSQPWGRQTASGLCLPGGETGPRCHRGKRGLRRWRPVSALTLCRALGWPVSHSAHPSSGPGTATAPQDRGDAS